jgi:hypothetical protein
VKRTICIIHLLALCSLVVYCATPRDNEFSRARRETLRHFQLVSYSPNGEITENEYNLWVEMISQELKDKLSDMTPGYIIVVTGHVNKNGKASPEEQMEKSRKMAETAYRKLRDAGVDSPLLTSRGAGAEKPLSYIPPENPRQCRITLELEPGIPRQ